ncbi:hypothetical protein INR49_029544 [Caranx melampygus]|nr:hypothetical protein INR49_029544 [Caranx melampygus]
MKRLERLELCRREPVGLAEMEEKLRVIFDDRIEKLVLPSGIPPTVEELQTTVKENFGFSEEQVDENLDISFGQHSTDCDSVSYAESSASIAESSASNAESSAGTSSSLDAIILPRQRSITERCQPWPKQFPFHSLHTRLRCTLKELTKTTKRMEHF